MWHLQSSWFPSPSCSPPRGPSPIKSLTVSACVSAGIIHFWVLDKRLFLSPGRGPPSCNICTIKMLPNSSLAANWKSSVGWKGKVALFRRPAISGEGGLMSKNQLWRFCSTMNVSKRRKGKLITVNHLGRGLEFSLSFTLCRLSSGEGHGNHSSILIWKIPWTEEPGRLQSMELLRVGHDWATSLSLFTFRHWRRKWQPTPVFLPGESQGWRSLVGCRPWGSHRVGYD